MTTVGRCAAHRVNYFVCWSTSRFGRNLEDALKNANQLREWGTKGVGPGQFSEPHTIAMDSQGRLFVGDRENNRIQIFSPGGEVLAIWTGLARPGDLFIDTHNNVIVGEMAWVEGGTSMSGQPYPEGRAAQMTVRDLDGRVLTIEHLLQ